MTMTQDSAAGGDLGIPSEPHLLRNDQIAAKLEQAAELLAARRADPFRIAAYRRAADAMRHLDRDAADIEAEGGQAALDAIPAVGPSIARAVAELLHTGRWQYLERLRAETGPVELFASIPGIGPALARRLHETGHYETLQELEAAAHDGRLVTVPGIGLRRAAVIRSAVADMFGRVRPRLPLRHDEPGIDILLDVDRDYREKTEADTLPKIAPKRFNPTREAWLPVLHARRDPWEFTALFSNTARAHELGRQKDWVVIYASRPGEDEIQRTVVTEHRGPLVGRRVVRGREAECRQYYGAGP